MNVLWFSLSPCGSTRRKNIERYVQGWMVSLEDELKKNPNINLSVCFFSETESEQFEYQGVNYYPILYQRDTLTPIQRIRERTRTENEIDAQLLPFLMETIKKSHPDIIHIHGTEERFGIISNYVSKIPIVYSIQGLIAPIANKFFSGIPCSQYLRQESILDKVRRASIINAYNRFVDKGKREIFFLKKAQYVIGRTHWDKYITALFNPDRQYYTVNEILRKPFYCNRWKGYISSDKLTIVSIISTGPYKGYESILQTAMLLKTYLLRPFEWKIIGLSENTKEVIVTRKNLQQKFSDYNISLMGRKTAEEIVEILTQSDLFVHLSHIENSPNCICEAMLLGMPVIATFAGGTSSIIRNNINGILVQEGEQYSIAATIAELIKQPRDAIDMANNAYIDAHKRHSPENVISELLNAYDCILHINSNS